MSFRSLLKRKPFSKKIMSSVLATALAFSAILTPSIALAAAPEAAETQTQTDDASNVNAQDTDSGIDASDQNSPEGDAQESENQDNQAAQNNQVGSDPENTENHTFAGISTTSAALPANTESPAEAGNDIIPNSTAMSIQTLSSGVTALGGVTIDPSNMSTWTVYDHYYRPDKTWSEKGAPGWNDVYGGGYHPYFYWKEKYVSYNKNFYDLTTNVNKQRMDTEVFGLLAPKYKDSPAQAYFSQHIYSTGTPNSTNVTFLGYGKGYKTDFAIAPSTKTGMKSISFDIDWNFVNPHTLTSFGFLVNSGVDKTSDTLLGYAINFKLDSSSRKCKTGTIQLVDLTSGANASKLHKGESKHRLISDVATGVIQLGKFSLEDSPVSRAHFEIEVHQDYIKVRIRNYRSENLLSIVETVRDYRLKPTGLNGFGPIVNYNGSHSCAQLSSVTYSNLKMSENYSIVFDGNGATVESKPNRINDVEFGKSLADIGLGLPTAPQRTGHTFIGWNTMPDGSGTSFTANTPINALTTVYAQWKQNSSSSATIKYTYSGAGSLNGNTSETVALGASPVSVPVPVPASGATFKYWIDNNKKQYSSEADIQKVVVFADMTFTAVFDNLNSYNIQFIPSANGTLQGSTTVPVNLGSPIGQIPTPIPDSGYKVGYFVDTAGSVYPTAADVEAIIPTQDMTIMVVFEKTSPVVGTPYVLCYTSGAGGKIVGEQHEVVFSGDSPVSVPTPVPENGFKFVYWECSNGNFYPANADVEALIITENLDFAAIFDNN